MSLLPVWSAELFAAIWTYAIDQLTIKSTLIYKINIKTLCNVQWLPGFQ